MQSMPMTERRAPGPRAPLLLLALVPLADLLIWQVGTPRLAFVMFAISLTAAAQLLAGPGIGRRAVCMAWGGLGIAVLPLVEEVQFLSVLFALAGLIHAAGWCVAGSDAAWAQAIRAGLRLFRQGAIRIFLDLFGFGQAASERRTSRATLARNWALPVGLGGLFVLLLLGANPVLDRWLQSFANWSPQFGLNLTRFGFWLGMGGLIWPFLRLDILRPALIGPPRSQRGVTLPEILLNPGSVLRALLTFNLIFALQTGLDLTYLWGGVSLPAGMSFATYAHRGAYPLLATALLAGGFALIAQPFLPGRPLLRGLLYVWVAQNILLVASSILRLDLYVDAYGLTRLRFAAFIWMGLVVAGLVLMVWQIARGKPVGWLFARAGLLGLGTVYICCFINVAGLIARHNLDRPDHVFDVYYLCSLGDGAIPAIAQATATTGQTICWDTALTIKAPQDLREWGYRNTRLRNSLAAMAARTTVRTNP